MPAWPTVHNRDHDPGKAAKGVGVLPGNSNRHIDQERRTSNPVDQWNYLERVVAEAMDAEFQAYQSLPEIDLTPLSSWFCPGSPAIKEILNLLYRHQKKGWIISNTVKSIYQKVVEDHRESNRTARGCGHHHGILVSALVGPE
jgi:FMN phosphatase YigB (HAD superfamily)